MTNSAQVQEVAVSDLSDLTRPVSVNLRESEYEDLQRIADTCQPFGATRMAVMNEAIRMFLRMHQVGMVIVTSYCEDGRVKVEADIL